MQRGRFQITDWPWLALPSTAFERFRNHRNTQAGHMSLLTAASGTDEMPAHRHSSVRRHILTVSLEDYFQGAAFRSILNQVHWSRFDQRVEKSTARTLDLLAFLNVKATFFVSAWLAERIPHVIKGVAAAGHEIASSGVMNLSFRELSEPKFREEVRLSRTSLEQLTSRAVRGYRVADRRLTPGHLWALKVLAEEGYDYDSSLSPSLFQFRHHPEYRVQYQHTLAGRTFWELPLPCVKVAGIDIPIAGGNYLRQMPESFMRRAVRSWMNENDSPFIFYFRAWDLDPEQPEITGAPVLSRIRHYRHVDKMPDLLTRFLAGFQLTSISDYLGLSTETAEPAREVPSARPATLVVEGLAPNVERGVASRPVQSIGLTNITIVVPCFNESDSLSYLSNALRQLQAAVTDKYHLSLVFVDDGSRDETWSILQHLFGGHPDVQLVRHAQNRGVTAAILTGLQAATTELVCSIDCDCTYDPMELTRMMLLMTDEVDCVTASPYHPKGSVVNVPVWRLAISSMASHLYQIVLGSRLHTFTSCFRIYRRSRVLKLSIRESGFVGVAEILGNLVLQGGRIDEYPTTLAVRVLGHSKMKVVRNTALHLNLLSRFVFVRTVKYLKAGWSANRITRRTEDITYAQEDQRRK